MTQRAALLELILVYFEHLGGEGIDLLVAVLLTDLLIELVENLNVLIFSEVLDLVQQGLSLFMFRLQFIDFSLTNLRVLHSYADLRTILSFILCEEFIQVKGRQLVNGLHRFGEPIVDNWVQIPVLTSLESLCLTGKDFTLLSIDCRN